MLSRNNANSYYDDVTLAVRNSDPFYFYNGSRPNPKDQRTFKNLNTTYKNINNALFFKPNSKQHLIVQYYAFHIDVGNHSIKRSVEKEISKLLVMQ